MLICSSFLDAELECVLSHVSINFNNIMAVSKTAGASDADALIGHCPQILTTRISVTSANLIANTWKLDVLCQVCTIHRCITIL